jgi:hypothetical protein
MVGGMKWIARALVATSVLANAVVVAGLVAMATSDSVGKRITKALGVADRTDFQKRRMDPGVELAISDASEAQYEVDDLEMRVDELENDW